MCADREFERALVLDAGRIWRQMGTRAGDEYGRALATKVRWCRIQAPAGFEIECALALDAGVRWRRIRAAKAHSLCVP